MSKDFSTMTDDEKLQALKDSGRISDDGAAETATAEETKAEEPEKPKEDAAAPEKPAEEPEKPEEEKEETPEAPKADPEKPEGDEGKKTPEPTPEPKRPVRFIPIPQYQQEKTKWKEEVEARDAKIAALEAQVAAVGEDGKVSPELLNELAEAKKVAADAKEREYFETEWSGLQPRLKELYPEATPEQLAKVKETLNTLGHTQQFHDKDLDYVLFKSRETVDALVAAPAPAKEGRKTVETGRPGAGAHSPLTAKDFEGRKDFDDLEAMDEASRRQIVKDMSPKAYAALTSWLAQRERDQGLTVQRDGRTIVLK